MPGESGGQTTVDAHRVRYRLPKPRPDDSGELILSPQQLIERLVPPVPPPTALILRAA